ncbi:MAG TPA: hypothetical protein VGF62_04830, partial [Rhizomicrobium sp.]
MDRRIIYSHALDEELRVQSELVQACARHAAAARDPRLKSAWIDVLVRLMDASAAIGSVIADMRRAPAGAALLSLAVRLRLPKLPSLPDVEQGTPPPPPDLRKTTAGGFVNEVSWLGSSPAKRGRGTIERSED